MLKKWPAKILLFGEYTVLNGSKALATPFDFYSGSWSFSPENSNEREVSRKFLTDFILQAPEDILDLNQLKADFDSGIWFNSTIPHGFGLGSSGALIAAIYEKYGKPSRNNLVDMRALAILEHYFHGSSSGIDPLVSLLQKPLLIHNFESIMTVENQLDLSGFFILNTGHSRQTGPLVKIFKSKMEDSHFSRGCSEVLVREVNSAVDLMFKNDSSSLAHHLWIISKFQHDYFSEMIPHQMKDFWSRGLKNGDYILKLCGAGGGGFLIGYSAKLSTEQLKEIFNPFEVMQIKN